MLTLDILSHNQITILYVLMKGLSGGTEVANTSSGNSKIEKETLNNTHSGRDHR